MESPSFTIHSRVGIPRDPRQPPTAKQCLDAFLRVPNASIETFEAMLNGLPRPPTNEEWAEVLYESVRNRNEVSTEFLLRRGVDPNTTFESLLHTPIVHAILARNLDMCRLLLQYGADLHHKTYCGDTPYSMLEDLLEELLEKNETKWGFVEEIQALFDLSASLMIKEPSI